MIPGWLRAGLVGAALAVAGPVLPAVSDPQAPITAPGDYQYEMEFGGALRHYRVHVPRRYAPDTPMPMLLALHGGGGTMDVQAEDRFYGQISKSEQAGYIVVFPNGYSRRDSGKLATWNAGRCCAAARDRNVDDVGFIRAVVARLRQQLNVEGGRIFAAGMSNGGMMSYRLACEAADLFRAVASVAGTDNTLRCTPSRPVSILHIHARDDDHVLFNGGSGKPSRHTTDFVSVADSTAKWVGLNHCALPPQEVLKVPGARCEQYGACAAGTQVRLCVTDTGGHSWPGGQKPRGEGTPSTALSATDQIWAFFSALP